MSIFKKSIPAAEPSDIIAWAEADLKVDGHSFDAGRTPQIVEPIRAMVDVGTRVGTFVKPVQSGGSTAGEVVLAFWLRYRAGKVQFNWQDDQKAVERWKDRILPLLETVDGLKWAGGFDRNICAARMINATLVVQGVIASGALDSETIPMQLNEEVHLWSPGTLDKARRRQTLVWNCKALDISNAGNVGDQLDAAYEDGSMEVWEVRCPHCNGWHEMRFRWDEKRPDLGGLRFDTSVGRVTSGKYNLSKVAATIRYQMPCGGIVRDSVIDRRRLVGRYRKTNDGALASNRSWTYEAVSVAEIRWSDLVSEWLKAVKAMKGGDIKPMEKFVKERECRFWGEDSIPFSGQIIVNNTISKSREGLKGRAARFWFADKQKGYASKGELTHYWLVIRDVMPNCDSCLVFEGLCQTDADLVARLIEHQCVPQSGAVDCGWDRTNVLQMCFRNDFNAQTTTAQDRLFYHPEDKTYRIFSKPEGLHKQLRIPPKRDYIQRIENQKLIAVPHPEEPLHWNIHKLGSIKLLLFLRNHEQTVKMNKGTEFIKWEVPGDVSDDYRKHLESWESATRRKAGTNEVVEILRQRFQADHMLICEAGIANLMAMAPHPEQHRFPGLSILSVRLAQMGISESVVGGDAVVEEK